MLKPSGRLRLFLVLAVAALAGCREGNNTKQQGAQGQPQGPIPVGTVAVQPRPVNLGATFVGRINAIQKVDVRARVSDFIEARLFNEGSVVEPGQLLFRIERSTYTYEAVVEQRRADLMAAQAQAENAEVQLRRARELARRETIAQAALDECEAAARQAQAALRQGDINLAYTEITAPIKGRTGRAAFDVGALVGPDSPPLVTIVSEGPTYVMFPVSQRRLLEAQKAAGEKGLDANAFVVRVRLSDDTPYPLPAG